MKFLLKTFLKNIRANKVFVFLLLGTAVVLPQVALAQAAEFSLTGISARPSLLSKE